MKLDAATLEPIWVKTIMTSGGSASRFTIQGMIVDGNGDLVFAGIVTSGNFFMLPAMNRLLSKAEGAGGMHNKYFVSSNL